MKNLILLILLVSNFTAFSQGGIFQKKNKNINQTEEKTEGKEVPKRTFKIIVKNNFSADENFILVGKTLIDNDWSIDKKDKDFYTIKSGTRELYKSRTGSYSLDFAIKDKSISVTGTCTVDITLNFGGAVSTNSSYRICYKGMNGSIAKDAFIKMAEFAKKLGTEFDFVTEQ